MMPYDTYRLYQTERAKSTTEILRADQQAAQLVAAASSLFRALARLVRALLTLCLLQRLRHSQRQQASAQRVVHRLAGAKVGCQRDRGRQLGQPQPASSLSHGAVLHRARRVTTRPGEARMAAETRRSLVDRARHPAFRDPPRPARSWAGITDRRRRRNI